MADRTDRSLALTKRKQFFTRPTRPENRIGRPRSKRPIYTLGNGPTSPGSRLITCKLVKFPLFLDKYIFCRVMAVDVSSAPAYAQCHGRRGTSNGAAKCGGRALQAHIDGEREEMNSSIILSDFCSAFISVFLLLVTLKVEIYFWAILFG